MKAHLQRIERSHEFWFLTAISVVFFFLRLPSLFEPYWYGDEGIYETIGLALSRGQTLYTQIWDNKPPLLYYTYALFQGDQFSVRFLSLLAGLGAVVILFFLAQKLFHTLKVSLISAGVFALLFGLPIIEGNIANAENFMLLPIIAAALLVYSAATSNRPDKPTTSLLIAGLMLGIAFLYKIVAVFDFAAMLVFLLIVFTPTKLSVHELTSAIRHTFKLLALFIGGFLLPFVLSLIYFFFNGALSEYLYATFLSTVGYVGYNNVFIIPQGLLITKLLLLAAVVLFLFIRRKKLSLPFIFLSLWTAFSLFNSFFSQRPYTHYLLVLLPSFSLLLGSIFYPKNKFQYHIMAVCVGLALIAFTYFDHWSLTKTIGYYGNFISFITGRKELSLYESFFDRRTPRDSEIVRYLLSHDSTQDILVWGNNAQIYYQTGSLPPTRFTVTYHIQAKKEYENELAVAVKQHPPKFVVVMPDSPPLPTALYNYTHVLSIKDAAIYELIR